MGISSNYLIELMEERYILAREEWIRDQLGDNADEDTPGWDELVDAYNEMHSYDEFEYDDWSVPGKSRFEIFDESIKAAVEVLGYQFSPLTSRNIMVMLHAHVVAAVEAFLSKTFIEITLSSDDFIRLLVESDPEFATRKFTVKEIFVKKESLRADVSKYLQDLIFHKIEKIKPLYKSILGIDFQDVDWLFKAVALRHHCVHRAGYDKDGNEVNISIKNVRQLIANCYILVNEIDSRVMALTENEEQF